MYLLHRATTPSVPPRDSESIEGVSPNANSDHNNPPLDLPAPESLAVAVAPVNEVDTLLSQLWDQGGLVIKGCCLLALSYLRLKEYFLWNRQPPHLLPTPSVQTQEQEPVLQTSAETQTQEQEPVLQTCAETQTDNQATGPASENPLSVEDRDVAQPVLNQSSPVNYASPEELLPTQSGVSVNPSSTWVSSEGDEDLPLDSDVTMSTDLSDPSTGNSTLASGPLQSDTLQSTGELGDNHAPTTLSVQSFALHLQEEQPSVSGSGVSSPDLGNNLTNQADVDRAIARSVTESPRNPNPFEPF